jgi:hypothetical protein
VGDVPAAQAEFARALSIDPHFALARAALDRLATPNTGPIMR